MDYLFNSDKPDLEGFRAAFFQTLLDSPDPRLNISPSSSSLAGCRRQQGYTWRGVEAATSRSDKDRGEGIWGARMGNVIEPFVSDVLAQMGYIVEEAQAAWALLSCKLGIIHRNDKELLEALEGGHGRHKCYPLLTGHPDGMLYPIQEVRDPLTTQRILFELKNPNFKRFMEMASSGGVENYDDDGQYYIQTQMNMEAMGTDRCLFMLICKDPTGVKWNMRRMKYTGETLMHLEVVEKKDSAVSFGLERAQEVVDVVQAGELPPRDYEPEGGQKANWRCRWCDYWKRCLEDGA